MQEAVSKTGVYDIFNDFPYTMPDAVGAKVIIPLDDLAKKYQPDFSGIADGLKYQQYYDNKLYVMVNDGDHLLLVVRKDLVENPEARAEYKAKTGKDLGCPDTVAEWTQQAQFFQTKEGDTRWGIKFEKGLSGGLGYRSINFSYRHFPVYMKGLLFDKDMKPRITTPDGIQAIKDSWRPSNTCQRTSRDGARLRSTPTGAAALPTPPCRFLPSTGLARAIPTASSRASSSPASFPVTWSTASWCAARRRQPAPGTW